MNYRRARGKRDKGLSGGGERERGEAISTHLRCRPRADRGIPGASLDWQRLLSSRRFSQGGFSVKQRLSRASPALFLRGRRGQTIAT